jgi:hypothetical protein
MGLKLKLQRDGEVVRTEFTPKKNNTRAGLALSMEGS